MDGWMDILNENIRCRMQSTGGVVFFVSMVPV